MMMMESDNSLTKYGGGGYYMVNASGVSTLDYLPLTTTQHLSPKRSFVVVVADEEISSDDYVFVCVVVVVVVPVVVVVVEC